MCEANLAGSFEKASRILKSLAGLELSDKRVQLVTERVGEKLAQERQDQTTRYLERRAPASNAPPEQLLVVTLDGGRVQTRQQDPDKKWKEDKVGVVYNAVPQPEQRGVKYQGPAPVCRSTVATLETWDTLADHLSALADRRGYATARQKVCMGDGAPTNRATRDRCFPDATLILDWIHAVEHLGQTAQAAFGPGPQADDWAERQKDHLWNGRVKPVISAISRLSRKAGSPAPKSGENDPKRILAANLHYFKANSDAMNYPLFRTHGWPIGSGIIESAIKQIGKRVKGSEKHWSMTGVEATLQVVAHLISDDGDWDSFWKRGPFAPAA